MNIGAELRQAREAKGLSVAALAATTRIPPRAIDGIERNDLSTVPPHPYARGFVAAYAREVGLNPERIVSLYFAQFEPAVQAERPPAADRQTPTPRERPTWGPALGILTVLIALGVFLSWPAPLDDSAPAAVGTTGTTPPAGPAGQVPVPPVASSPRTEPAAPQELIVVLDTEHRVWISATIDGTRALYEIVPAGTQHTLRASRELTIRVGDAGAVRLSVNGGPAEPLGARGQVRTVTFTN